MVAAGMSSRMKAFKPMLPFGDSTISLHIISLLKTLGIDPIVVVTGHLAKELEAHLSCTGVRFVKNERYRETQMFDSVKLGIHAISEECDRIMIMPMDIPAIMPETFRRILKIDADLVRTVFEGEPGHPVIVRSRLGEELCGYKGNRGLRGAIEQSGISVTDVEVEDQAVCWDVDTPQEYQDLLDWNFKQGKGYPVRAQVQVCLTANGVFFGPGTAQLIETIDHTGSLQEACLRMGLSYSKGSRMVKSAENQLGMSIVERWTGGSGGGGSALTDEGRQLLRNYQELVRRVSDCTESLYRECFARDIRR